MYNSVIFNLSFEILICITILIHIEKIKYMNVYINCTEKIRKEGQGNTMEVESLPCMWPTPIETWQEQHQSTEYKSSLQVLTKWLPNIK